MSVSPPHPAPRTPHDLGIFDRSRATNMCFYGLLPGIPLVQEAPYNLIEGDIGSKSKSCSIGTGLQFWVKGIPCKVTTSSKRKDRLAPPTMRQKKASHHCCYSN